MYNWLLRFYRDRDGASALEYALLGSLIAAMIVVAVASLGTQVQLMYEFIRDQVVHALQ